MAFIAQDMFRPIMGEWLARVEKTKGTAWYALIDTAFDHEQPPFSLPLGSVNCYEDHPILEKLTSVAPVLIPLGDVDLPSLIVHCNGRPMLSFLMLEAGQDALMLAQRWMPLHRVEMPDGSRFLLRFADTRVLADFPVILTKEQRAAWQTGVDEWHYFDREGVLRKLPSPFPAGADDTREDPRLKRLRENNPQETICPAQEITFDDEQLARVIERGETDALLNIVTTDHPTAIPEDVQGSEYYLYSEAALKLARRCEIESVNDKISLIFMNVSSQGLFVQIPELEPFLKEKNWKPDGLSETLNQEKWILNFAEKEE